MTGRRHRLALPTARAIVVALTMMAGPAFFGQSARAQAGALPDGPKPVEDFETDGDGDGVPDGWYNFRDARVAPKGHGEADSKCLRFEADRPGRPARASRAFGVDGREVEAIVVGAWVRAEGIAAGERLGDEPGLVIDFLGDPVQLKAVRRGVLGPWNTIGRDWTFVSKRLPIPPDTRLAILSMGLIGATGVLEVDDLSIELVPVGGRPTANLVVNGDFELGDHAAVGWLVDRGAQRVHPGRDSASSVELKGSGARAYAPLGLPVSRVSTLEVSVDARGSGLRGANAAFGLVFFLDDDGQPLAGSRGGVPVMNFGGSFPWTPSRGRVDVPRGASRALIQFEKGSAYGTLAIDNVSVVGGDGSVRWTPYHVETPTRGWTPVAPSDRIEPGSALDASGLLDAPAGKHGFVGVKGGHLAFDDGTRARFFGVSLLPPTAFLEPDRLDALLDRLARSGVNLIRLAELDTPLGPARSLFDDARDDTKALDPVSLARLDHLIAAAARRGIYVAIELQGARRFRAGDESIAKGQLLPPGGGPAAAFDPAIREAARAAADLLLNHPNAETGRSLRDEPALAWFTLAGELTLFDLPELDDRQPKSAVDATVALSRKDDVSNNGRGWQSAESAQWSALAGEVRKLGLRVPIAGGSHWKRDPDYASAQAAGGLDLIDDRLYYASPSWVDPDRRSLLWARDGGLIAFAARKRKLDRAYVVGQWAVPTQGAWASPFEGADLMLAAASAAADDWDALVRRGVFVFPKVWGSAAAGTGGGEDIFSLPEVLNGIPQAYALLPHAASVVLQGKDAVKHAAPRPLRPAPAPKGAVPGWDPRSGRLVVDTPRTRGVAGASGEPARFEGLTIEVDAPYGVVMVSSAAPEPVETSRRLLVTAVSRVEPTGFRWVDDWRRDVAEPGRAPLLHEGLRARVTWRRPGTIKAYALDDSGARVGPARASSLGGGGGGGGGGEAGSTLEIDAGASSMHWELVVE